MIKKRNIFFCLILVFLLLTGCNLDGKDVELEKNIKPKKNYDEYLKIEYINKYDINCDALKDAKYFDTNTFTTNNDEIYIYFIDKLFSDDTYYRKFDKNKIVSFQGEKKDISKIVGIAVGEDGSSSPIIIDKSAQSIYLNLDGTIFADSYGIRSQSEDRYNELMNSDEWHGNESGFMIKNNNKWLFNKYYVDYEILDFLVSETIISLNRNIIKTDKSFYILKSKSTNKEECNKYADVECNTMYYVEKIDTLNEIYDKVIAAYDNYNTIRFVSNEGIIYEIKK